MNNKGQQIPDHHNLILITERSFNYVNTTKKMCGRSEQNNISKTIFVVRKIKDDLTSLEKVTHPDFFCLSENTIIRSC